MAITEVYYGGKEELTMAQYEALKTLDDTVDYDVTDHPTTFITNEQMAFALTCSRLFPVGSTYICSDDGEYFEGRIYKMSMTNGERLWELIGTPVIGATITDLTGGN